MSYNQINRLTALWASPPNDIGAPKCDARCRQACSSSVAMSGQRASECNLGNGCASSISCACSHCACQNNGELLIRQCTSSRLETPAVAVFAKVRSEVAQCCA